MCHLAATLSDCDSIPDDFVLKYDQRPFLLKFYGVEVHGVRLHGKGLRGVGVHGVEVAYMGLGLHGLILQRVG